MKIRCKYCYHYVDEDEIDDFLYELDIERMRDKLNREIKRLEYKLNLSNIKWKEVHENIIDNYKNENHDEIENKDFFQVNFEVYEELFSIIDEYNSIDLYQNKIIFRCPKCEKTTIYNNDIVFDDLRFRCSYCKTPLNKKNLKKHLKKCKIFLELKNLELSHNIEIEKNSSLIVRKFYKYIESENESNQKTKVDFNSIKKENLIQDEIYESNLQSQKDKTQKENTPKLKEQISKYKDEVTQYDENLDIDIITDEEQYQKDFIQKIQEDIKEFDKSKQSEIVETIVIVRKKGNSKKIQKQHKKIKDYLYQTYKGYCQICEFTFRKAKVEENSNKNSFERFNWNDKRIVKQKKSFITTADSLCLCRNCSANIKFGAFEPIFMDKINAIEDFANKSLDEIKEVICVDLEDNIVDKFRDDYEWSDIYALEITVNDKPKNIYMTNGHLIQFIAYLQLEEE